MGWGHAWGGQCGYEGVGRGWMGFGGGLSFLLPLLGTLLFVAALAAVILFVIWAARRRPATAAQGFVTDEVAPLELARRRLALGEITLEEFEQVRSALTA